MEFHFVLFQFPFLRFLPKILKLWSFVSFWFLFLRFCLRSSSFLLFHFSFPFSSFCLRFSCLWSLVSFHLGFSFSGFCPRCSSFEVSFHFLFLRFLSEILQLCFVFFFFPFSGFCLRSSSFVSFHFVSVSLSQVFV